MKDIWRCLIFLNTCVTILAFSLIWHFHLVNVLVNWGNALIDGTYHTRVAVDRHVTSYIIVTTSFVTYLIFSRFFEDLDAPTKARYRPLRTVYHIHLATLLFFLFVNLNPLFLYEIDWVWAIPFVMLLFSMLLLHMTVIVETAIQRFRPDSTLIAGPTDRMSRTQL